MKVHLLKKNPKAYPGLFRISSLFATIMVLIFGIRTPLLAEGSVDFIGYDGLRMFLDTNKDGPQQLKVYAESGETINVGASHLGMTSPPGGYIRVYNPTGVLVAEFTSSSIASINNSMEELGGPTGGSPGGSGYIPGIVTANMTGVYTVIFGFTSVYDSLCNGCPNRDEWDIMNGDPWTKAQNQPDNWSVILAWDITVSKNGAGNNGGELLTGRVYSNEHISMLAGNNAINGDIKTSSPKFYVLTEDGYLYRVNINEASPFRFPISSNSLGLVDGNGNPIYKSLEEDSFRRDDNPLTWDMVSSDSIYLYEPQAQDSGVLINNKLFFNEPNSDLPQTAMVHDFYRSNTHTTWLLNQLEILEIDSVYLEGRNEDGELCAPNTIEFEKGAYFIFETNIGGVLTLKLDLSIPPNGSFDDPEDRIFEQAIVGGVDQVFWDGFDGNGVPIAVQDSLLLPYDVSVKFGELHIALTDVEGSLGGVTFLWDNAPPGFPRDSFYYDHSAIDNSPNAVSGGNPSLGPQPTEIPYVYPIDDGNNDYIDQWFFIETQFGTDTLILKVVLNCVCDEDSSPDITVSGDACEGDTLILIASNANTTNNLGPIDYSWTGPNGFTFEEQDVDPAESSIAVVSNSATSLNNGTYQVIATTSSSCADTFNYDLVLKLTPVLETDEDSVQVCENDNAQLCANNVTSGIGQMTCQWTGPNGFFSVGSGNGTDSICLDLTNIDPSLAGQFTLICITDDGCESAALNFNVDVNLIPIISNLTPNSTNCQGADVTLTASNTVMGTGPITYTWSGPNTFSFTGVSQNELGPFPVTISNIQPEDAGVYTLVLTTEAGCSSTPQSTTVEVDPVPVICSLTGGGDACVGQNVTLSASNCATGMSYPISYVWTDPGGATLCSGTGIGDSDGPFTCDILNIQPNDSGTYCLVLTDSTGCASTQECTTINVFPIIIPVDPTPDSSYCEGSTVTLTASTSFGADVIYTWTAPNGSVLVSAQVPPGSPLTGTIFDLSAADAGNYILTLISLDGCVSEAITVFVGLLDGITIDTIGGGGSYCINDTAVLTGTGSGNSATVDYEWVGPNGDVVGFGTTPPEGPFDATVSTIIEGTYILTVTTPDGCDDVDSVMIEFADIPIGNIVSPTIDTSVCELDSLILCAQNTNPNIGFFIYTWSTPSGETITGSGTGTDVFCDELDPMATFGSGTYTLVICEGNCCSDPVSINISLNPNPVMSVVSGGGTYCEGDTAIVCFSNTNPEVANWFYTCNYGSIQTTGMGTGTNEICLEITTSTFVFCSLESLDSCTSDLEGTQVIFEPNYTPEIMVDTTICANDTLQLNGSNMSICTGTVTYTWTGPNGFTISGTADCSGPFPAEDPNPSSGEYCLSLDSGTGSNCSEQACTTVVVLDLPFVVGGSINGGGEYCEGDEVDLTATVENPSGGDINYDWTKDGVVVVSGTAQSGETITLDLGALGLDAAGQYCLNLTCIETGCSDEGLGCAQIIVNVTPIIDSLSGSGIYCQGFDLVLNGFGPAGPGTVTYTWTGPNNFFFMGTAECGGPYPVEIDSIDVDQAGIYTLVVMKGMCMSDSASVIVEVNPTPIISNTSGSGAECAGETTISFTIDPNGADSVMWCVTGPGLDTCGWVSDLTDFDFPVVVSGTSTYIITAVSNLGCEADPMNLTITEIIVPVPPIDVDILMPCPGETITLSTDAVQGATYTWCLNGNTIAGPLDVPTLILTNPMEGTYTVKITVMGCTEESADFVLTFPPPPVANDDTFTTDAGVPVSGNILTNDIPSTGVTVSVVSGPANGSVSVGPNGEMTYTPNNGFSGTDQFTYEICSIDCPDDCDEAVVTITVITPPCEVPNVITPNGDDVNDVLIIDCVPAYPNNRLRIFNRWGDEIEVFEPYTNSWDGTIGSGKDPVPAGTYFYLFQEDKNSDDHVAGYIKVVR